MRSSLLHLSIGTESHFHRVEKARDTAQLRTSSPELPPSRPRQFQRQVSNIRGAFRRVATPRFSLIDIPPYFLSSPGGLVRGNESRFIGRRLFSGDQLEFHGLTYVLRGRSSSISQKRPLGVAPVSPAVDNCTLLPNILLVVPPKILVFRRTPLSLVLRVKPRKDNSLPARKDTSLFLCLI